MTQVTSLLVITPIGPDTGLKLPPYSARGLQQSLQPITGPSSGDAFGNQIQESINGETLNFFPPQFNKFMSTISCKDVQTPCLDRAYIGQKVVVDCTATLGYPAGGSPSRAVVPGTTPVTANGFTHYRPRLSMMLTGIGNGFDEFGAQYAWQLYLREILAP